MSNLTELQAIVQDIMDCGATRQESVEIVAEALGRSVSTVYGWLSKGQTMPIPDHLLELLKRKLEENE